jgi:uncharacterized membrane protein
MSSKIKKSIKKNTSNYNNIIKNISGKNSNGASLLNPMLYSILAVTLISIAYISSIIYYLNTLKSCKCFQEKNEHNYSNLTFLIIIESIILTMNIILVLGTIYLFSILNNSRSGGAENKNMWFYLWFIIYLGIYGYFIYNVYKIYENIDPNCDCTENWLRYLLYIQAVVMLVNVLLIVAKVVS